MLSIEVLGPWVFLILMLSLYLPGIIRKRRKNKIASLVVTSRLRSIPEIARHANMSADKVIKILRLLTAATSDVVLANEAKYLKDATINLQTMEVILSDKHTKNEPWTCVYCRAVNTPEALVCSACHAPKKKL